MNKRKLLNKLLKRVQPVTWSDFIPLVESFGFILTRINGSHHIYKHGDISELLNLQRVKNEAKPYQIKQFLKLVEQYNLILKD